MSTYSSNPSIYIVVCECEVAIVCADGLDQSTSSWINVGTGAAGSAGSCLYCTRARYHKLLLHLLYSISLKVAYFQRDRRCDRLRDRSCDRLRDRRCSWASYVLLLSSVVVDAIVMVVIVVVVVAVVAIVTVVVIVVIIVVVHVVFAVVVIVTLRWHTCQHCCYCYCLWHLWFSSGCCCVEVVIVVIVIVVVVRHLSVTDTQTITAACGAA